MGFRLTYKEKEDKKEETLEGDTQDITSTLHSLPDYRASLLETEATLMKGCSSLPPTHRHYIALLACSTSHCPELTTSQAKEFLRVGGDPAWLSCPEKVDPRLIKLVNINKLMGNTPWLIASHHIRGLTVGSHSWTLTQVVQALTILAHYHSLCTLERGEASEDPLLSSNPPPLTDKENRPPQPSASAHLMVQDFCWADHGFSVMSPFHSDLALLLDDKFRLASKLMLMERHGDKEGWGRSVWNYVQAISGVRTDDCNYSKIGEIIQGSLRKYIHNSCVRVQHQQHHYHHYQPSYQYQKIGPDITSNQKVLVSVLVIEAKLQAELLFALRAVMKLMT